MPTSTVEEVKDYHQRILDWYNDRLKGDLKKKADEVKAEGVDSGELINYQNRLTVG